MNPRTALSLIGLVVIAASFVVLFEYSQYSNEAFYVLLAWIFLNFALLYAWRPRAHPAAAGASSDVSPFPSAPGAPLPTTGSSSSSSSIGFCIFCAAPVPPGTRSCPACGHALPQW